MLPCGVARTKEHVFIGFLSIFFALSFVLRFFVRYGINLLWVLVLAGSTMRPWHTEESLVLQLRLQ